LYTINVFVKLFFDNALFYGVNNMKKEFLCVLGFAFIVCFSSDMYSMKIEWELTKKGEVRIGHVIYPWLATGNPEFCYSMEKNLAETMQTGKGEGFIFPSPEDQKIPIIQICQDGKLFVHPIEELEHFVIRDPHGKIIINTKQKQKQLDSGLLDEEDDEEDIKSKAERLQAGGSITAVFSDDSKLCVTFDQIITFVSKTGSSHPVRLSQVEGSSLISGMFSHDFKEKSEKKK